MDNCNQRVVVILVYSLFNCLASLLHYEAGAESWSNRPDHLSLVQHAIITQIQHQTNALTNHLASLL